MQQPPTTPAREFAIQVVKQLREAGYQAVWAGGCVRDELLGQEPKHLGRMPKDYDIATSALPEQVRELFGRRRTLAVGAAFGVIIVLGKREEGQIDVATFRGDVSYQDGRRPDAVHYYDSPQADAARRDFTINGLFYDPLEDEILDFVGGVEDIHRGVIRAIGDAEQRFAEDKLRMLRAVRFATTFQFQVDPATLAAIRKHAADIKVVSGERIAMEMRRMLADTHKAESLRLLHATGLQQEILPEVDTLAPAENPASGTPWQQTLQILSRLGESSFPVGLAGLLRYVATGSERDAKTLVRDIGKRWRLSSDEIKHTTWLLHYEPLVREAHTHQWHELQPVLIEPGVKDLLQLAQAVASEQEAELAGIEYCREKLRLPLAELNPPPLVDGHDLLELGVPASRILQTLLREIRNEQLEGRIATKPDALTWAQQRWSELAQR